MKLEMIDVDGLEIDPRAQRDLNEAHAGKLAAKFDIRMFGCAVVSVRDGERYILDAQHRIAAAKEAGFKGKIPAVVHEGLSIAEEAGLFLALNNKKAVDPVDKFNARVTAGEPLAVAVDKVLDGVGFGIAPSSGAKTNNRAVQAVSTVESVYKRHGGRVLAGAFMVISQAWPTLPKEAVSGRIIAAVAGAISPVVGADESVLIEKLAKTSPGQVLAEANYLSQTAAGASVKKSETDIDTILKIYNKGAKRSEWIVRPD